MVWSSVVLVCVACDQLEVRAGEIERARAIQHRYIACHISKRAYIRFAKWEERQGQRALARRVFERGLEELPHEEQDEEYFTAFASFERRCHEMERARVIYKYALEQLDQTHSKDLYMEFVAFEKAYGDREGIEVVITNKRRAQYEEAVQADETNYDAWFDYIRLEEDAGDVDKTRALYERAVAAQPPLMEKRYWKRYIYLWLNYAVWEEAAAEDVDRAREVYKRAIRLVPHKQFTFAKLWIMAAHLEVRALQMDKARKVLGQAIGMAPKPKLFDAYIQLELELVNIDRCRTLYAKYLEFAPHSCDTWIKVRDVAEVCGECGGIQLCRELWAGEGRGGGENRRCDQAAVLGRRR